MKFHDLIKRKYKILCLAMLWFSLFAGAQNSSISPYSRFGLGDRDFNGFALNMHMAGLGAAIWDSLHMNPYNPATYSNLILTSMEMGTRTKLVNLSADGKTSELAGQTQLSHFAIGFPIGEKFGGSFGLFPYSSLGYSVVSKSSIDSIGDISYLYRGSGGLNAAYGGFAAKPFKGLSVGLNMVYLFGNMDRSTGIEYDNENYFNSKSQKLTRVSDLYFNFGLQYKYDLNDKLFGIVGAQWGATDQLSASTSYVTYNYRVVDGQEFPRDTVQYITNESSNIQLPQSGSVGISFGKKNNWMFSTEYSFSNYSEFKNPGLSDSLANSYRIMAGGYFVPDGRAVTGFWKKTQYRFGFHYGKTPLVLNSIQLEEYGMSFGFGLPFLSRTFSTINIGAEIGQRGTTDNGLIKENYYLLNFSLTLNDKWFIKRKID